MNINSAFPSKYLKAADAEDGDLVLTITTIKMETVGVGANADQKPILFFREVPKGLVLNRTNSKMIEKIAGSADTDDWKDVKIRLIATEVEFQGDLVMSLRVRELKKMGKPTGVATVKTETADAPSEDDIPFMWLLPILLPLAGTALALAHGVSI